MRAPHSPSSTSSRPLTAPRLRGTCSILVMTFTPCTWVKPCVPTATHGMDHYSAAPVCVMPVLRAAPGMPAAPRRERSVTGEPPVGEAGAAPGGRLGRRLVAGDPAGDHLRGD